MGTSTREQNEGLAMSGVLNAKYSAMEIAQFLVELGIDRDQPAESSYICPLRLQKLLYFCQGWSLALMGRPLFRENLEAWVHGPVVREVYARFAGTSEPIKPDQFTGLRIELTGLERSLVQMVWSEYSQYQPKALEALTHSQTPWIQSREGLPADKVSDNKISLELMREFFIEEHKRLVRNTTPQGCPVPGPDACWDDSIAGGPVPAKAVFASLLGE